MEGLEPIGATNPETNQPYHEIGYNIELSDGVNIPVYQRGENGALAITQQDLEALGAAGYKIEPAIGTPYSSSYMSTDPSQRMIVAVGGTTITSDHSGSNYNYDTPNKFKQVMITPPKLVQTGFETVPDNKLNQTGEIAFSGNGPDGSGGLPLTIINNSATSQITFETNNAILLAPSGTTRVITGVTFDMNSNVYSSAQINNLNAILNKKFSFKITINNSTSLPSTTYYTGGTFTYDDYSTKEVPVFKPLLSTVKITDLVP
ncbi:hypothetical protein H9Y05_12245 [Crocinitomicaceae bacterium CZZ-1]|uniref:Uncharacterized protein n=1 Tax=Taishania pollutisoli TaxID=2766479 RepID=A0A8J6TTR4_9FLAO|nr:hypothetical protein [Taishania pollutisoli]MBC9813239.1 hypothetical protein [Taishania pollutisoli]NGF76479.1 hypothetical protein [Fluviicola sp. SGL-29]